MSDKPTIHLSLADLDRQIGEKPDPFRFALKGGYITFPDPGEMDWVEAEEFMSDVASGSNATVLKRWLSAGDYDRLRDAGLTLRQLLALTGAVEKHYQGVFGTPGEGNGSTGS